MLVRRVSPSRSLERLSFINSPELSLSPNLLLFFLSDYDYTEGNLPVLIDVIIDSGAKLFVSAVGVPPKEVVDKLHKHGIPYANMIVSLLSSFSLPFCSVLL